MAKAPSDERDLPANAEQVEREMIAARSASSEQGSTTLCQCDDGDVTVRRLVEEQRWNREEIRLLRKQVETLQGLLRGLESERARTRQRSRSAPTVSLEVTETHTWTCGYCTFENAPRRTACEVCEGIRRTETESWDVTSFRKEDIVCDSSS